MNETEEFTVRRQIRQMNTEYETYCRDESRSVGYADSISFPETEDEIREILRVLYKEGTPVTVQGGRTGLTAGSVPYGGHAMNLIRMNRFLGMRKSGDRYYLRVQPGLPLLSLRKALESRNMDTAGWAEEDVACYNGFCREKPYFFPTDPTETSATLGGMTACNASGARSYRYGAMRNHVTALRVVLSDGDLLVLRRGEQRAAGRQLSLTTSSGRNISLQLPTYIMPDTKNASGYYAADDMDAVDLFVGSDGTLGVVTEIEIELLPQPAVCWGISCFFETEEQATDFTIAAREKLPHAIALEYFDGDALELLRQQKAKSTAYAALPDVDRRFRGCVFVELSCGEEETALSEMYLLGELMEQTGASEEDTWVGRTGIDRDKQQFFRHAIPESNNMRIDERRKKDPVITKLAADMSVPNCHMKDVIAMYRRDLKAENLESAVWGHFGNNHLHVNVLPRDGEDYHRGKAMFARWAKEVTAMGGAVSAEHGIGKLKTDFLMVMYGEEHIREMVRVKRQLDPRGILGQGNLFRQDLLAVEPEEMPVEKPAERAAEKPAEEPIEKSAEKKAPPETRLRNDDGTEKETGKMMAARVLSAGDPGDYKGNDAGEGERR